MHVFLCASLHSHSVIESIHDTYTIYCSFSAAKYSAVDCIQWVQHSSMLRCVLNKNYNKNYKGLGTTEKEKKQEETQTG